jgi:DNA-binding FadR family transcriptional regulator
MSRTDRVVDRITEMILDGRLGPGDRLPIEKDLAQELDVSRGSLREAVRALTLLGVLSTRQGDGTYVTSLDAALLLGPMALLVELQGAGNAPHIHEVRRLLETEAAGLAAAALAAGAADPDALTRARDALAVTSALLDGGDAPHEQLLEADLAFHQAISDLAGNPVLAALNAAFATRTTRGRLWRAITQEGAEVRTHQEHELILAAIDAHDPVRARIRMAAHLLGVEDSLDRAPAVALAGNPAGDPDATPAVS